MTTPLEDHGTPWKLDESEIFERLLETGTDPIEAITEFVQNACDSILPPLEEIGQMTAKQAHLLSNEIDLWIPDNGTDDIVFVGQDHGLSIAKDYDYDIHKFINAAKGTSTKREHPWSSGRKGVGMIQYLHLANKIEIVSQDSDHKGCIYRFYIYWGIKDGKKIPYFSDPDYHNITPEFQKRFGIFSQGTKLTFIGATEDAKTILGLREAAIKKIRDIFGLILARNPNLIIKINGVRIKPPEYMIKNKEKQIIPELGITGNLWEDKNGTGEVEIFGEGGLRIMTHTFRPPRRFSGYLINPGLKPDTGRKLVKEDKIWKTTLDETEKIIVKFPKVPDATDENKNSDRKIMNMFESIAPEALRDLLPLTIIQGARNKKPGKKRNTGHVRPEQDEDQTPGYPEPNPIQGGLNGIHRSHKRDNTHQQFVGLFGIQKVVRVNDHSDQKQEKNPPIIFKKQRLGKDVLLLDLVTEVRPWVLYINKDNRLYNQKISAPFRSRKEFLQRIAEHFAMVRMQTLQQQGKLPKMMELFEFRSELEKQATTVLDI